MKNILLWHPLVHRLYYNEGLYYFALRFAPYKQDLLPEIKKCLIEAGINGICLYEVFGEYDVLLRAWLIQSQLAEVYEIFRKFPTLVAYPPFRVKDMKHWAFGHDINRGTLKTPSPETIRTVQKAARSEADEDISQYVPQELTYYGPVSERGFVKFYTALSLGEPGLLNTEAEKEMKAILFRIHDEQIGAEKPKIKSASVYWGEGFANMMIKGISRDNVKVRDFIVKTVIPKFSGALTVTTFIICEGAPYESDEISERALSEFMTGTPPLWVQNWFPDFYRLGADATMIKKVEDWLSLNYNNIQPLSEEFKGEILKPLLQGVITGDSRMAVKTLLPWFAEAEFSLKENWFNFLRAVSCLERDPVANAEFEIKKTLGLLKESKKEITLGDRLNMHLEALKKYQPKSELLAGKVQAAELTNIRNDFAHGDILRNLSTRWQEVLDLLFWFLPRYEGVLKLARKTKAGKEGE